MIHNKGLWPHRVELGDILVDARQNFRVVRGVAQDTAAPFLTVFVQFAIHHCSWTGRPHTTLNYVDLKTRGFKPTGFKETKVGEFEKLLEKEIRECPPPAEKKFTCCDVVRAGVL